MTIQSTVDGSRWLLSLLAIIGLHGALAWSLSNSKATDPYVEPGGALVFELAAVPVAREDLPVDIAPGPDQVASRASVSSQSVPDPAKAEIATHAPQSEQPEIAVPPSPFEQDLSLPPKFEASKPDMQQSSIASVAVPVTSAAQVDSEHKAGKAAASSQGTTTRPNDFSVPTWRNKLERALELAKRFPDDAKGTRGHKSVTVQFVIDRSGTLVSSSIHASSGHPAFDREALDLLRRAQPFPSLPDAILGNTVSLVVPIRFHARTE